MADGRYAAHLCHEAAADATVAGALHRGLERLASSWRRRRALHIHRGPARPDVLASCDWLVLVASPAAAASSTVADELEWWLAERGAASILPVVVDGTWSWDESGGGFSWEDPATVTAVPPVLRGAFAEEPRHLDLSWASADPDLTLRNARFRDQVAELAAPMHGVTKEDLEGEDVRQQRRNRRVARAAVTALAVLGLVAVLATALAVSAQREAVAQRKVAEDEADRATERARVATGRRLATVARTDTELPADVRMLLAAQAHRLAPGPHADVALFQVLAGHGEPPPGPGADPSAVSAVVGTGVRSDFTALTGIDLIDPTRILLDRTGSVIAHERDGTATRYAAPTWEAEPFGLPPGASLEAVGDGGRLAMVTRRPPPGDPPMLLLHEDFSDVPPPVPGEEEGPQPTIREPQPCPTCMVPVLVDLDTGEERVLVTEVAYPGGAAAPRPHERHRFSDGGQYLVSWTSFGSRLFSHPTAGGDPVEVETDDAVVDFGIVDGGRAWQLTPGAIHIVDLASGAITDTHPLPDLQDVVAADVDLERSIAVVGTAPSTITVLDLDRGAVLIQRDTLADPAEVELGPAGRWLAVAGSERAEILVRETLTTVGDVPTRFFAADDSGASLAFAEGGNRLLVRPVNAAPATVFVIALEPEQWYRAACAAAGRTLTPDEWDRYVGLAAEEPACSDPGDRETTVPIDAPAPTTTVAPTTAPPSDAGEYCSMIEPAILEQIFPDGRYDEQRCRNYLGDGGG